MSKSPKRVRQVADVIRQQVAVLLKREVSDPRLEGVTIVSVDVSADLSNARVYFTVMDPQQLPAVNQAFEKATGFLRKRLASLIDMRYVPKLSFIYDKALERGARISDLLDKVQPKNEPNDE